MVATTLRVVAGVGKIALAETPLVSPAKPHRKMVRPEMDNRPVKEYRPVKECSPFKGHRPVKGYINGQTRDEIASLSQHNPPAA